MCIHSFPNIYESSAVLSIRSRGWCPEICLNISPQGFPVAKGREGPNLGFPEPSCPLRFIQGRAATIPHNYDETSPFGYFNTGCDGDIMSSLRLREIMQLAYGQTGKWQNWFRTWPCLILKPMRVLSSTHQSPWEKTKILSANSSTQKSYAKKSFSQGLGVGVASDCLLGTGFPLGLIRMFWS